MDQRRDAFGTDIERRLKRMDCDVILGTAHEAVRPSRALAHEPIGALGLIAVQHFARTVESPDKSARCAARPVTS